MAPVRYGRAGAVFPEFQFLLCARAKGTGAQSRY